MTAQFTGAVFIATSLDGYIARSDGDLDWLISAEGLGDTGYESFMSGIDLLVMGRATYEKVLTFDSWPYEGRTVFVLSTRLATTDGRIEVYPSLHELVEAVAATGARRVYVDGG